MGAHAPSVPFERAEFRAGGPDLLHPQPDREGDAGRHDPPHVHDHQLGHGPKSGDARDQRDRHDEPPGGGRRRRIVGAPRRSEVVDARLRVNGERSQHVPRGHAAHQLRAQRRGTRARRSREPGAGLLRGQPGRAGHRAALRQCPGDPPDHADQPQPVATVVPAIFGFDRSCSSWRRTTSCAPSCTSRRAAFPACTTWPGRDGSRGARSPPSAGPGWSPLALRPAEDPPLARLFDLPPELEDLLRYGRGVETRRFAGTGFTYNATSAGAVRTFIRALRLRRQSGRQPASYRYEHDVEQFFRHSPSVISAADS